MGDRWSTSRSRVNPPQGTLRALLPSSADHSPRLGHGHTHTHSHALCAQGRGAGRGALAHRCLRLGLCSVTALGPHTCLGPLLQGTGLSAASVFLEEPPPRPWDWEGITSPALCGSVLLFCPFLCLYLLAHLCTSAPFSHSLALPLWSPPLPRRLSHTPQLPSSGHMSQLAGATAQAPGAAPQVSLSRSAPPARAVDRLHSGQELPVSLLPQKSGRMCSASVTCTLPP